MARPISRFQQPLATMRHAQEGPDVLKVICPEKGLADFAPCDPEEGTAEGSEFLICAGCTGVELLLDLGIIVRS